MSLTLKTIQIQFGLITINIYRYKWLLFPLFYIANINSYIKRWFILCFRLRFFRLLRRWGLLACSYCISFSFSGNWWWVWLGLRDRWCFLGFHFQFSCCRCFSFLFFFVFYFGIFFALLFFFLLVFRFLFFFLGWRSLKSSISFTKRTLSSEILEPYINTFMIFNSSCLNMHMKFLCPY